MQNIKKLVLATIFAGFSITSGNAMHENTMQDIENIAPNLSTGTEIGMLPPDTKKQKMDTVSMEDETTAVETIAFDSVDRFGSTALHKAAIRNDVDFLLYILQNRISVNVNVMNQLKETPLHTAAEKGHVECLRVLLNIPGINVNAVDLCSFTPLHLAAQEGKAGCLMALLEDPRTNVNALNQFGRTALYFAKVNKHSNCVKILLAHGGEIVTLPFQIRHITK